MATQTLARASLIVSLLSLCACAHQAVVPDLDSATERFPAAAGEYRTTVDRTEHKHRESSETMWRIWREADRIVTENLSAHTGEVWQRDGATVFHQKVFHDDRKSVEFQMDDLRMNNVTLSWPRQALLIDPGMLSRLSEKSAGWRNGYPYRRYTGKIDGSTWDVTIRTDLLLPVMISRTLAGVQERTELVAGYALPVAPWTPTPREDYDVIDSADLGDRQADPFVVKVQDQLGRPHTH